MAKVDVGIHNGDHIRVGLPLIIITGRVVHIDTGHMLTGSVGTVSSYVVLDNARMSRPSMATSAVPLACASSHFLFLPSSISPHHVRHFSASLRKERAWACS